MKSIAADTLHRRSSIEDGIAKAVMTFKNISPILSHYSIPPLLHYSINVGVLGHPFDPFQGFQTRRRPLGGFFVGFVVFMVFIRFYHKKLKKLNSKC